MGTSTKIDLSTLRFDGSRFEGHALDVECAQELVAYRGLVLACAKELWLRGNPDRANLPRRFGEGFRVEFDRVEPGLTTLPLQRIREAVQVQLDFDDEFDGAALLVDATISAAARDELLPEGFPANVVPLFKGFGQLQRLYSYFIYNGHHAIWKLLANTVLRRTEALNLCWRDVRDGRLWIESIYDDENRPHARTKSSRWRSIPINQSAQWALDYLKERITRTSECVLPQIAKHSLSRAFAKCRDRAGLEGTLHSLRHTFISHLVMAGKDLRSIVELAGHTRIEVTMKYSHLSPAHLMSAVESLDL